MSAGTLTEARRSTLHRRVRFIVGFTITYNVIEAIVAIWAGSMASSAALIGFGLDSIVEVLSAAAVAWQFTRKNPERWEKATVRAIGSRSVQADAKQLLLCIYLSGTVLIGLLLNLLFGWMWADSVAALIVAGLAIREGIEAWRGDVESPFEVLGELEAKND